MTWSRHPRRRVPTNLWVIAFAFGLNSDRLLPPFSALELKRRIIRDHYREVIDEMYAVWRPRPIKVSWPRRRNSPRALLPEV